MCERVLEQLPATGVYYRLMLLVGPDGSGKTRCLRRLSDQQAWPMLNVNRELSERLMGVSRRRQPFEAAGALSAIIETTDVDVVLVDNIELVFDPGLGLDPLRALQSSSRNRTLVVAWPGVFEGSELRYAQPGHPEARSYRDPDAIVLGMSPD